MSGARLHTLANGVRIVCDPMTGLRTLAVSVMAGGGARHEASSQAGWSHLLEHMVFKGAGDRSAEDIVRLIEAEGGSLNAATGHERTSFQARALAGGLGLCLETLADLVFRPILDPAELEREKGVIAQEIAEAFDTPDDHVFEMAQASAFGDHPLGRPILGTVESLAVADRQALADWRTRLYDPARLVVSVSGAVDEDELLALCERLFGQAEAGPGLSVEPPAFVGSQASLTRRIEQANLVWLLPGLAVTDPDLPALSLFVEILGGGMASRLFQSVRERQGLAYAVDAWFEAYGDTGVLGVFAGTSAADAVRCAGLVADEIRALSEGASEAELAGARNQATAQLWMALESPANRAERNAAQVLVFGRPIAPEETAGRLADVGLADLRRVGEGLLRPRRAAGAVLGARGAAPAAGAFSKRLFDA